MIEARGVESDENLRGHEILSVFRAAAVDVAIWNIRRGKGIWNRKKLELVS